MLNFKKIKEAGLSWRLLWDLFMITVAIVNLALILFDLTYLWLRPWYYRNFKEITAVYDPYLGIEPHRFTENYIEKIDLLEFYVEEQGKVSQELRDELIELSRQMIKENPFHGAGLRGNLEKVKARIKKYARDNMGLKLPQTDSSISAFLYFYEADLPQLKKNIAFFNQSLKPLVEVNYYRHYDVDGKPVNDFIKIDLPFLLFFLVEFLVRWIIAIRRKQYIAWFLFPLYNWYDILSLLPVQELRFFRLFRIVSIYIRLKESVFTHVGDDFISKTVKKYSNIIAEEISDMVAIKILSEVQSEIRAGASFNLVIQAIEPRREAVKRGIVEAISTGLNHKDREHRVRELLAETLELSAKETPSLAMFPDFLKVQITRDIGVTIYDSLNKTLKMHIESEDGHDDVSDIVDYILDDILQSSGESELAKLIEEILIDFIEKLKEAVSVKKWADDFKRQNP